MRRLALLLLLAACSRPLTDAEREFTALIQGPETAASRVRFLESTFVGRDSTTYPVRPRTTCRERILPPAEGETFQSSTAGIALWDHVITSPNWYLEDYLANWPERLDLSAAMFFAHEMTHVWQWQNAETTGYTPLRAATEHVQITDPYLFDDTSTARFLDYGYEQQASLVEEYVCCAAIAPDGARTDRLARLLGQVMPVSREFPMREVLLPWNGVEVEGICG